MVLLEEPSPEMSIRPRENAGAGCRYCFRYSSRHREVVDGRWVDLCKETTESIKPLAYELPLQQHLRALWEDKVIKEARGAGCLVESKLLQYGESDAFVGRRDGWLGCVLKTNLEEFEQRMLLEEGRQIPKGYLGSRRETEPREGAWEGGFAKIRVHVDQCETGEFWKSTSENGTGEFHVLWKEMRIVRDPEVLQLGCWFQEVFQKASEVSEARAKLEMSEARHVVESDGKEGLCKTHIFEVVVDVEGEAPRSTKEFF